MPRESARQNSARQSSARQNSARQSSARQSSARPSSAPSDVPLNAARRYAHVDALRAYSVVVVVLQHAGLGFVPGGSGVTIFFAISGFIITFLLLRERDRTGGFSITGFYARRATKLAPPFLVAIVVPTLIWSLGNRLDWAGFGAQVFFVWNWVRALFVPSEVNGTVLPGSGIVWSLSIEEQFYIVFALVWLLFVRRRWWRGAVVVLAAIGILAPLVTRFVLALDPANVDRIYNGTDTRVDGIAWGVLTAVLLHRWQSAQTTTAIAARVEAASRLERFSGHGAALALALVLYGASLAVRDEYFQNTLRYTLQSAAACLVILYGFGRSGFGSGGFGRGPEGASRLRRMFSAAAGIRIVQIIGLASYSIYLAHLVLIEAVTPALESVQAPLRIALLVAAGLASGILIWAVVERPIQSWSHGRRSRRATLRASLGE